MKRGLQSNLLRFLLVSAILAVSLTACAPSVKVRSDVDPTVNLNQYRTYGFFSQLGIEGNNYSGLLGQHFRGAVAAQMDRRGFTESASPQLQINVSIGSEEKVRVNTYQDPYLHGGYYGRGYGYYGGPWGYPFGGGTTTTVHQYTEARVYIDLVDTQQHKMVWQGVATFTLTDKLQKNIRQTVYDTVDKIFTQFPVAAPESGN